MEYLWRSWQVEPTPAGLSAFLYQEEYKPMKQAPWNDSSVRWVCEDHPTYDQGHLMPRFAWLPWLSTEECGGAGMVEDTPQNRAKGYFA